MVNHLATVTVRVKLQVVNALQATANVLAATVQTALQVASRKAKVAHKDKANQLVNVNQSVANSLALKY
ncbi:hypothetical protein OFN50_27975, partial [Escherichia coli]|nr:hypothetical protein [Escherichia coli]